MRGRSTFARLELARYNPGAECALSPIVDWAKAIWGNEASVDDLKVAWQRAHTLIGTSQTPFRHVAGPGGAALASCMRIGWRLPRYDTIIKADGSLLDMTIVCPMQIRLHAARDLRRTEAEASSLAMKIGGPPDLEPLSDFLAQRKVASSPAASSLRALGEGAPCEPWERAVGGHRTDCTKKAGSMTHGAKLVQTQAALVLSEGLCTTECVLAMLLKSSGASSRTKNY